MTTEQVRQALEAGTRITSLASLVRVAIEDGRRLNPELYTPDHAVYHAQTNKECRVCLAGAVMVSMEREAPTNPENYGYNTHRAMLALDSVRCGALSGAYHNLRLPHDGVPSITRVVGEHFFDFDSFTEHLDYLETEVLPSLRAWEATAGFRNAVRDDRAAQAAVDLHAVRGRIDRAEQNIASYRAEVEAAASTGDAEIEALPAVQDIRSRQRSAVARWQSVVERQEARLEMDRAALAEAEAIVGTNEETQASD